MPLAGGIDRGKIRGNPNTQILWEHQVTQIRRSDYFRKVVYKCNSTSRKRDGLRSGLIPTHFNLLFGAVSPPDHLLYRALDLKAVEWTTRLLFLLYPARRCQTPHALRASRTWISRGASSSPTRFVAAPEDCDRVRCQDDVLHWLEAAMDMKECCKIVGSMRGRFVEPAEGTPLRSQEIRRNKSGEITRGQVVVACNHSANVDCTMGELADKVTNDSAEWLGPEINSSWHQVGILAYPRFQLRLELGSKLGLKSGLKLGCVKHPIESAVNEL
ncbi:hypothetical protein DFH08DRAFT_808034 [Mycena albidolilacea]|uniref:Uncharacterized protein n=1 Tax=Mycena albidolilacea TaxID=1033008 RepID=A0AAD7ERD5_9AGAR|nr:hypothetical protein DFH08DRAFT_808034 [Mycena albidolilacea]